MKKSLMVAVAAVMSLAVFAPAQSGQHEEMMHSGPWPMRASTGNMVNDQLWFVADRTLNAAEAETLHSMFRRMPGSFEYTVKKAIVNAIDMAAKNHPDSSMHWSMTNGLSDMQVDDLLYDGLSWTGRGVVAKWENRASNSQLNVVRKLVQNSGWAQGRWTMMSPEMSGH